MSTTTAVHHRLKRESFDDCEVGKSLIAKRGESALRICVPAKRWASRPSPFTPGRQRADAPGSGRRIRLHRPGVRRSVLPAHPAIIVPLRDRRYRHSPRTVSSRKTRFCRHSRTPASPHRPEADPSADGRQVSAKHAMIEQAYHVPGSDGRCRKTRNGAGIVVVGYPVDHQGRRWRWWSGMGVVHKEEDLIASAKLTRSEQARRSATRWSIWKNSSPIHDTSKCRCCPTVRPRHPLGDATARCSVVTRGSRRSAGTGHRREGPPEVLARCVKACIDIGYRGAGTFEFLRERSFLLHRMNTVFSGTPGFGVVTGIDIVKESSASPLATSWRSLR